MKKTLLLSGLVITLASVSLASAATIIKPWRENAQVSNIVTTVYKKNIAVYRIDDDNGVTCYVATNDENYMTNPSISCVKTK